MCNLYRLQSGNAVIAQMFGVDAPAPDNRADEFYPGYPGVVLAQGALRTMAWGFPVVLKGRQGQPLRPRPVTNARDDKLHTRFWRDSFVARRCLIPADAWAEPEGADRAMTRTWYAPAGEYPFAIAGLWRPTDIWDDTYAMVMVDAAPAMVDVHDRMPVLLRRADWGIWLDGAPEAAFGLVQTWQGRLDVDRTTQRWSGQTAPLPLFDQ